MKTAKTNKQATKTARRSSSELAPLSWVGEMEAAQRKLESLRKALSPALNLESWETMNESSECMRRAVESQRRISPTAVVSDSGQKA